MGKNKLKKKTGPRPSTRRQAVYPAFDLDVYVNRYIWLLVPLLVLLYYWFSTGSTGFYQDDEIGHYRNIRQFWGDPFSIMGNQPKPGWKILMVLPGLFGFPGVVLAHSLVSALTVLTTYFLCRQLGVRNASIAAILLAVQPLFLQLSFRSYSEITAGLFVVLSMLLYYRKNYALAAVACSYIFSIRQEFALVALGMGAVFLFRRKWVPFLLLAWTPLTLGIIGWLATGNMLWLLDDMRRIGLNVQVPHKPFWHYFETYIFMVGPVTLALFLVGYWGFLRKPSVWKAAIAEHGFLFFTFTIMWAWSVFSAWDVPNFGANPGHWRYLLSIAPLTAVYAGKGLNSLMDPEKRAYNWVVLTLFALVTLVFLSRESNGLTLTTTREYGKFMTVVGVMLLYGMSSALRALPSSVFAVLLALLALVYTFATEKPRKLDPEAAGMKELAEWYQSQPESFRHRPLYCNHVLFRYFADIDINDKERDRPLQLKTLEQAPAGSVVIWDSHYGNSQFGGDVPFEYFKDNPNYRYIHDIVSTDRRFQALVFEKTVP
ncbi:MAG: hypothetical protein QHI48_04170 [Bacteroidota bacterium]|nr:hypothetical protein [Bacteroidota bacterium]